MNILSFLRLLRYFCFLILWLLHFAYNIYSYNNNLFSEEQENKKIIVEGRIVSLIEESSDLKYKFDFELKNTKQKIRLVWDEPPQKVFPGDVWLLMVKLKRPRNYANPGSFNVEKHALLKQIVANGYVINQQGNILLASQPYKVPISYIRQRLLHKVSAHFKNKEFIGVIIALSLGTKSLIPHQQWQLMQNTGVAHIMSISGMHIGLVAALVVILSKKATRAPKIIAYLSLVFCFSYGLLSGFSLSTQRSLIMLSCFLLGILCRRIIKWHIRFKLALFITLSIQPLAILNPGFWLSYFAVALLYYDGTYHWLRTQALMALGMLPLSVLIFAQFSTISFFANLITIPYMSFLVVPIAVIALFILPINSVLAFKLFSLAEYVFSLLWPCLHKLSSFPIFYMPQNSTVYIAIIIAAFAGLWLFAPRAFPGKFWAILGFMPLFSNHAVAIPYGQVDFSLLDVGQGLSAVIRTTNHVLIYDVGAKLNDRHDLGAMVVTPYLRALGVQQIDVLMISHADNDHIGGAQSLLANFPYKQVFINDLNYLSAYKPNLCEAGQKWNWDGVNFTVLHPVIFDPFAKRNDQSCVLRVQAGEHSLILTGDIEVKAEQELLHNYATDLKSDILLVPHHGSRTSSSQDFIQKIQPRFALISAGYKNQFGHPKLDILERYGQHNIEVLTTERYGNITFRLGSTANLQPSLYRHQSIWCKMLAYVIR